MAIQRKRSGRCTIRKKSRRSNRKYSGIMLDLGIALPLLISGKPMAAAAVLSANKVVKHLLNSLNSLNRSKSPRSKSRTRSKSRIRAKTKSKSR